MDFDQLVTLMLAAGGALAASIGVLFRTVMTMHKEHRNMLREHGDMKHEIGKLKGEREGIGRLSADILEMLYKVLGRHQPKKNADVDNYRNDTSIENLKRKLDL